MSTFAEKAKRYHALIHDILLKEWDPIGICHVPEAQDEYDSYVSEVHRLLSRRVSKQEIFAYLWSVETQHMGLCGNRQRTEHIANKLAGLVDEIEGGSSIERTPTS
jgi:hypothetical protein